jgi:mannose-6-phosphate isomerase-like protein (cupin superfamily)
MKIRFYTIFKHCLPVLFPILFMSSAAAQKPLISSSNEWNDLKVKGKYGTQVRSILKGETRSLKMFEIKAITLIGGYSVKEYKVKEGDDELFIIKEGTAVITVNDKSERLDEGSIVVASQGDVIKILNGAKNDMTFYSFKFTPRQSEALLQNIKKTEPVFKDWLEIEYKPNANGGRRDIIKQPTSVLKELEMHTTQLKEGLPSHSAHTHADEEIILVRFGKVEESINDKLFQCGPGSVLFLTNDDYHGIRNIGTGPCEYYAIRWLTY